MIRLAWMIRLNWPRRARPTRYLNPDGWTRCNGHRTAIGENPGNTTELNARRGDGVGATPGGRRV